MSFASSIIIRSSQLIVAARRSLRRAAVGVEQPAGFIEDIRAFCSPGVQPAKRALLSLVPSAWATAMAQAPDIRIFNINGLTYEVVKALNEKGYAVDIVDYRFAKFEPRKQYNFYLGHGPYTRGILDSLSSSAFVMQYMSGAYWKDLNRMSQERYDNFSRRRGLPPIQKFIRSFNDVEQEGEEYLTRRADAAFISGPRTAAQYKGISRNASVLYLGAYVEKDLFVTERDFEAGRANFLYVAGSGGNVQKGLDLLIEAFARMPSLHLYIYCKVEEEVWRAYRKELSLPNIHYVYHYCHGPLRAVMKSLLRRINFSITAPINIGPGTAFLGSMGLGLIPVGYVDIEATDTNSVLTDSYSIEALMHAATKASEKSAEWCTLASEQTLDRFKRLHDPPGFGANFKAYLDRLGV